MNHRLVAIFTVFITVAIYILTVLPVTRDVVNSMFVLYIVAVIVGFMYYPIARKSIRDNKIMAVYLFLLFIAVMFWVGVTGWFFSPFFYLLYLVAIVMSFAYSPFVTLLFVLALVGLFIPNIGSIDIMIDVITLLSLFSVVPLTYFLQKEYLSLKESENKVLILESERGDIKNQAEEVLLNKVIKHSVDLRQFVNDIKQIAYYAQTENKDRMMKELKKIVSLADTSLSTIEEFEVRVTGKKLFHNAEKKETGKRKAGSTGKKATKSSLKKN